MKDIRITIRGESSQPDNNWWNIWRNGRKSGWIQKSSYNRKFRVRNDISTERDVVFDTLKEAKAFATEDQKNTKYDGDT